MAAGQGFKTFVTGEVLTAGDVNGYLMQGINVFTNATARDAAITSPQEGQFAFTKDNNSLWYYDGAAWVASGATGDIEGVTAGVGISGGGTSGTVTITNSMATAIDAKGDLVAGTGADTFSRLAVGANNTVLTADSSTATGLKWAAPTTSGKSYSLLNTGGTALTGATTITVSGLSGYDNLMVFVTSASSASASSQMTIRFNSDTASNYRYAGLNLNFPSTYQSGIASAANSGTGATSIDAATMGSSASSEVAIGMTVFGANTTGFKAFNLTSGVSQGSGGSNPNPNQLTGIYTGTSVISSVSIISNTGNFDGGTIFVYGAV